MMDISYPLIEDDYYLLKSVHFESIENISRTKLEYNKSNETIKIIGTSVINIGLAIDYLRQVLKKAQKLDRKHSKSLSAEKYRERIHKEKDRDKYSERDYHKSRSRSDSKSSSNSKTKSDSNPPTIHPSRITSANQPSNAIHPSRMTPSNSGISESFTSSPKTSINGDHSEMAESVKSSLIDQVEDFFDDLSRDIENDM